MVRSTYNALRTEDPDSARNNLAHVDRATDNQMVTTYGTAPEAITNSGTSTMMQLAGAFAQGVGDGMVSSAANYILGGGGPTMYPTKGSYSGGYPLASNPGMPKVAIM